MVNIAAQDLFIIDRLTIESNGQEIDLISDVINNALSETEEPISFAGGATFTPTNAFSGLVTNNKAKILDNTDVVSGVVSVDGNKFFAILTSSDLDKEAETVGVSDSLEFNIDEILPDDVEIGDIGNIDFTFIQLLPLDESLEDGLSPLELAVLRGNSQSFQVPLTEDGTDFALFTDVPFIVAKNGSAARFFSKAGDVFQTTGIGVVAGGALGSIIPAIGNAAGAIGGGILGFGVGVADAIGTNSKGDDDPDPDPPNPPIPSTVKGDPHIKTLDGYKYDFHGKGEYILVETVDTSVQPFDIQVLLDGSDKTWVKGVATSIDGNLVKLDNAGLSINTISETLEVGESLNIGSGSISFDHTIGGVPNYSITYSNGDLLNIEDRVTKSETEFFNLELTTSRQDIHGLLGNNNGIDFDDLKLRDGTSLNINTSKDELLGAFADSWRVDPQNSLFRHDLNTIKEKDSTFFGRPDYNPSEYDGIMIWKEDNIWTIEATGNNHGSKFSGQIISSDPIQGLVNYALESNDKVDYSNASNTSIDFDLSVWQKWTDGFSFSASHNASLELQLNNHQTVTVLSGNQMLDISAQNIMLA